MKQTQLFPKVENDPQEKLHALMVMREMIHASRESLASAYLPLIESGVHRYNDEFSSALEALDELSSATLELSMQLLTEVKTNE